MYFLNTLDETTSYVMKVLKNKNRFISDITRKDCMGRHLPALKIPSEKIGDVINHI